MQGFVLQRFPDEVYQRRTSMRSSFRFASVASSVALVAGLAACAGQPVNSTPVATYPAGAVYPAGMPAPVGAIEYGRVANVEVIRTQEPAPSGAGGAIIGGIAGAVLGHQIGGGSGRDLATIAGGVGGAIAGNAIQKNANTQVHDVYRVSVQVDNGAYRAYDLAGPVDLRSGDRVRIENGQLYRI
jgi:outer membrane lipoprotein SlyB